jgi:hypothetical protein
MLHCFWVEDYFLTNVGNIMLDSATEEPLGSNQDILYKGELPISCVVAQRLLFSFATGATRYVLPLWSRKEDWRGG